jgi:hypothetical protein
VSSAIPPSARRAVPETGCRAGEDAGGPIRRWGCVESACPQIPLFTTYLQTTLRCRRGVGRRLIRIPLHPVSNSGVRAVVAAGKDPQTSVGSRVNLTREEADVAVAMLVDNPDGSGSRRTMRGDSETSA